MSSVPASEGEQRVSGCAGEPRTGELSGAVSSDDGQELGTVGARSIRIARHLAVPRQERRVSRASARPAVCRCCRSCVIRASASAEEGSLRERLASPHMQRD